MRVRLLFRPWYHMPKNILIINEYAGSPSYGMTFRHYYFAKEFMKKGHHTIIVSASFSHFLKRYPDMKGLSYKQETVEGVDFLWIKVLKYTKSFDIKRAFKWLDFTWKLFFIGKALPTKPDVIICSTTELFAIVPAYYLSKKYKAQLVFEVRDIWPLTLIEIGGFSKHNIFIRVMAWLEKFSLQKSDILISNLSHYSKHLHDLNIHRDVHWIPNGIDLDEMEHRENLPELLKSSIPRDKFVVGYTGKLGTSNALLFLLQAARMLRNNRDIVFVLVGSGQEEENLKSYAADLENVVFMEAIPKIQIQSMLQLFDVCYLGLQKKDLFKFGISPNKLYDYMLSGKPILQAINIQNDIVEISGCGLCVQAEDANAIVDAIKIFYSMPKEMRKQLGEKGRAYVLQNFTYDRLAQAYLSCLSI
ncbi:glycosyltransferase family 4 protein [Sulfurospirillum cavolei]|uniref:glycosyltransferase family 4 protein n=1 Tax=Sulfurospirillum cavolei TaxID=366522 RepID=UPI001E4F68B2|nr:glycosyltransferase family 4 protein [Sulfurospirillum cavolei]